MGRVRVVRLSSGLPGLSIGARVDCFVCPFCDQPLILKYAMDNKPLTPLLILVFVTSLTGALRVTRLDDDGVYYLGQPLLGMGDLERQSLLEGTRDEKDLSMLELIPLTSTKTNDEGIELAPLWWLGAIIGLAGSCFSALGDNTIRKSFQYADETRSRSWSLYVMGWISTSIINTASTLAAYHYTTMTILAPCGGMHILFAVIFAVLINQESFGMRDGCATTLILTGVIGALMVAPKHEDKETIAQIYDHFTHAPFVIFSIGLFVITCILLVFWRAFEVHGRVPRLCVPILSGLFGAFTNLAVKLLVSFLGNPNETWKAFSLPDHGDTYWILTMMLTSLLGQVFFLNWGLSEYEAVSVVPVYSCTLITMSAAVSMFFFEEWHIAAYRLVLFPLFILCAVVGIVVLSKRDMPSDNAKNTETDKVAMLKDYERGSLSSPAPDRKGRASGEDTKSRVVTATPDKDAKRSMVASSDVEV